MYVNFILIDLNFILREAGTENHQNLDFSIFLMNFLIDFTNFKKFSQKI